MPPAPPAISVYSKKPHSYHDLHGKRDTIGAARAEERKLRRGCGCAVRQKEVSQTRKLGREQEQRHQYQVKREKFYRNVVRHVEREDVRRVNQAHQRPKRREPGENKKKSGQRLSAPGKDFICR